MTPPTPGAPRLDSLDQFRGYTVLGMFLVNFVGSYPAAHPLLRHHHTHCSYADTIMPQFFLAVGVAYRLTFLKRHKEAGLTAAVARAVRRCLALILVGVVVHGLDAGPKTWAELTDVGPGGFFATAFQRRPFQTLTHIGVTSLWVLPVLAAPARVRLPFAAACGGLFTYLSAVGYYDWVLRRPGIDGGPLGFLTWTIPLLFGTMVYDWLADLDPAAVVRRLLAWGTALMLLGYGLSCLDGFAPPPFVAPTEPVNLWTMSQRAGSVSYLTFATGFALALYAAFVWGCDRHRWRSSAWTTLGQNALAGYLIHDLVAEAVKPWVPRDAPAWYLATGFAAFFGFCYLLLRGLERQRVYLRL